MQTDPAPTGELVFDLQDQLAFARATGDWNPMHVDAVAARRLLTGRPVVHGIHTLMHALERLSINDTAIQIAATFANPISVGDRVSWTRREANNARCGIEARVDGVVCTDVTVERRTEAPATPAPGHRPLRRIDILEQQALDDPPGSQTAFDIELPVDAGDWAERFPRTTGWLGAGGLAALGGLSTFVGMVCPGLHSVFSSVRFMAPARPGAVLRFTVRRYDPRFRLFTVDFSGILEGELRAFLRPPPQSQPAAREVALRVEPDRFAGQRALVIGGSRGLGEVTAKIMAAGGANVMVTYATGKGDAQAVADDINALGLGRCETLALDLCLPFAGLPSIDPAAFDAVYFFATTRIYAKRGEVFDRGAFDTFATTYLQRFHELCRWLDGADAAHRATVYLPSTVFIQERPKGMTEYAMAKAAAEVLADDLNRTLRRVRIVHTRLPRLATDQTASLLKVRPARASTPCLTSSSA